MSFSTFTNLCKYHFRLVPNIYYPLTIKPCIHQTLFYVPLSPSPWGPAKCFLSLWTCLLCTFHIEEIMPYRTIVSLFFHLARFQGSSRLKHVSLLPSFLWLHNLPLCFHSTLCLSVLSWVDIYIVSTIWRLWIVLLRTSICLSTCFQFFRL